MSLREDLAQGTLHLMEIASPSGVFLYPVDMSSVLMPPFSPLNEEGRPSSLSLPDNHPTPIVQDALVQWNLYLATHEEKHREVFLMQARWLVEHEVRIGKGAGGWSISSPHPEYYTRGSWLSAILQGCGLSVLVRAYQLTQEKIFIDVARRVVRTFELDILDGGVSTPVGADGIFFEEVATYPAAHTLPGFIFALFGLYDYVALTADTRIEKLIHRSLITLHNLLPAFDAGYWTYSDLLRKPLSSPAHLALQITLLEALARHAHCEYSLARASHWTKYQHSCVFRLRSHIVGRCKSYSRVLWRRVQGALFSQSQTSPPLHICIPVPAFPAMGGVLTVLDGLAQIMKDLWHIEYLTQHIVPGHERYTVHQFGTRRMTPWYFPFVWLYVLSGARKVLSLMRQGSDYRVILPQDAVFSGAFAGLVGKLTGVRVVCIDHGDLSLFTSRNRQILRSERIAAIATKRWPWIVRFFARNLLVFYWPSRYLLARIAASSIDHYLIPGVAGDSIDDGLQLIGIQPERVTRYGSMIDINHHVVPDAVSRATLREQKCIAADAIVVAIVCRLAPEKGIDVALESIRQALSLLACERRTHVKVIIAGDGPLRKQIEARIRQLGLSQYCLLWGELSPEEVITLLGISDIFLYTSTRGACFAMAVLEAMASSCAVIATTEPLSNAVLLSDGRGIAVSAGDVIQIRQALVRLLNDPDLCHHMGKMAREYIMIQHSPTLFRRTLLRATYWSALDDLVGADKTNGSSEIGSVR